MLSRTRQIAFSTVNVHLLRRDSQFGCHMRIMAPAFFSVKDARYAENFVLRNEVLSESHVVLNLCRMVKHIFHITSL